MILDGSSSFVNQKEMPEKRLWDVAQMWAAEVTEHGQNPQELDGAKTENSALFSIKNRGFVWKSRKSEIKGLISG